MTIEVRAARADDAAEIRGVAVDAWRDTYAREMRVATIEAFLDRSYSLERLERRIRGDLFLVAVEDGRILAFANARPAEERLDLLAIYARPEARGRGAGTRLLDVLEVAAGELPITADVLLGNPKGEPFYAARGFEPRESLEVELFGEHVTLRRWWRLPTPT